VGVEDSSSSQPKSVGSAATWHYSTFTKWTGSWNYHNDFDMISAPYIIPVLLLLLLLLYYWHK